MCLDVLRDAKVLVPVVLVAKSLVNVFTAVFFCSEFLAGDSFAHSVCC